MEKCGIDPFEKKQKCSFHRLKSEKEKAILTAFKEMNIIVKNGRDFSLLFSFSKDF
ncbi:MAG: hypothetical protein K5770_04875 [Lachnospiraceae bacterium]|nr:hypothetical protein [Lachnospiraceae bacterium]